MKLVGTFGSITSYKLIKSYTCSLIFLMRPMGEVVFLSMDNYSTLIGFLIQNVSEKSVFKVIARLTADINL